HLHVLADLLGAEQQVLLDLVFRQADVAQAVVAHEGRAVAIQAVVDEQLGAVLQRCDVGGLVGGELVPLDAAFGGRHARGQPSPEQQREEDLFHVGRSSANQ